jgi:hypothetical protein
MLVSAHVGTAVKFEKETPEGYGFRSNSLMILLKPNGTILSKDISPDVAKGLRLVPERR